VKHARTISSCQPPTRTPPVPARFPLRPQLLARVSAPCGQGSRDSSRHNSDDPGSNIGDVPPSAGRPGTQLPLFVAGPVEGYRSPRAYTISRAQKRLKVRRRCSSPSQSIETPPSRRR
jgi:hypothetical protein